MGDLPERQALRAVEEWSELLSNLGGVLPVDDATLAPICDNEASQLLGGDHLDQAALALLQDVAVKLDERLADAFVRQKGKVSMAISLTLTQHADATTAKCHGSDHQLPQQQGHQHWLHPTWRSNQQR
jgi:hypothetical protein